MLRSFIDEKFLINLFSERLQQKRSICWVMLLWAFVYAEPSFSLSLSLDFNMVRHWSISDSSRFARKTTATTTTKVNIKIQFLCNFRASEQHRSNKWIGHLVYTVKVDSALELVFCNVFYFVSYVSTDFTVHELYPQLKPASLFKSANQKRNKVNIWTMPVSECHLCLVSFYVVCSLSVYLLSLSIGWTFNRLVDTVKYRGRERRMA